MKKVPYASITNFKASKTFPLQQLSQDDVFAQIKNEMLSENLFSAVKIYGTFKHMHVRMMPAQQPPYTRLIDSARRQPEEKETRYSWCHCWIFYTRIISWRRVCWFSYTFCG